MNKSNDQIEIICYQGSQQSKRWQLEEQDLQTFLQRHLRGVLK